MASSGIPALDNLLADGYPDKSAILVIGPPGIGKEALGYWFTGSGLIQGDFCLYVTRLSVKEVLKQNAGRRVRIVIDAISSLLMLNQPETIYRFLTQLFADVKGYDAVLLATLEEGMHKPEVVAAMQQLFDGVVELRLYEEGLRVLPLLRIRKMRGVPPQPGYFNFAFTRTGMELTSYGKQS